VATSSEQRIPSRSSFDDHDPAKKERTIRRRAQKNRKLKKPSLKPGKDYWKAKRYFKKFAKVEPPDNDYYLFYSNAANCKVLDPPSLSNPVLECDMVGWDGSIIGTNHIRCYVIGEIDLTLPLDVPQTPEIVCDRFRKFPSGNYFFEKYMYSDSDPITRSIIVGGTGTFVGATGESILYQTSDPFLSLPLIQAGEPHPPVPQVWFVKSLNAKKVAFDYWKDFDPDEFGIAPPDFSVLPEWYTNRTNSNLTMPIF